MHDSTSISSNPSHICKGTLRTLVTLCFSKLFCCCDTSKQPGEGDFFQLIQPMRGVKQDPERNRNSYTCWLTHELVRDSFCF